MSPNSWTRLVTPLFIFSICVIEVGCGGGDLPQAVQNSTASDESSSGASSANTTITVTTVPGVGGAVSRQSIAVNLIASANNYSLFSAAGSPTEPVDVTFNIPAGLTLGSTSTTTPALQTGVFPAGSTVMIVNAGDILGAGGVGGTIGSSAAVVNGGNGAEGGAALSLGFDVSIDNRGHIFGGGGGGAGGLLSGGSNGCGSNFHNVVAAATSSGLAVSKLTLIYSSGSAGGCWGEPGRTITVGVGGGSPGTAGAAILTHGRQINWVNGNSADQIKGTIN